MTVCEQVKCVQCGEPVSVVFRLEEQASTTVVTGDDPVCGRCDDERRVYNRQRQIVMRKFSA